MAFTFPWKKIPKTSRFPTQQPFCMESCTEKNPHYGQPNEERKRYFQSALLCLWDHESPIILVFSVQGLENLEFYVKSSQIGLGLCMCRWRMGGGRGLIWRENKKETFEGIYSPLLKLESYFSLRGFCTQWTLLIVVFSSLIHVYELHSLKAY